MKAPEKNEIVIAIHANNGLKIEGRLKADGELACSWVTGSNLVDDAFLFLLRGMLVCKNPDRHARRAKPLQTIHS